MRSPLMPNNGIPNNGWGAPVISRSAPVAGNFLAPSNRSMATPMAANGSFGTGFYNGVNRMWNGVQQGFQSAARGTANFMQKHPYISGATAATMMVGAGMCPYCAATAVGTGIMAASGMAMNGMQQNHSRPS